MVATVLSGATLCTPNQLAGTSEQAAGMGNGYVLVSVTNASDRPCQLTGAPTIEQFDKRGRKMSPVVGWPVESNGWGRGARSAILAPRKTTKFVVATLNGTGYGPEMRCGSKMRIFLNSSKEPFLVVDVPSCENVNISGYVFGH